jgi:nucleotide-binding universal stress UspA family protein
MIEKKFTRMIITPIDGSENSLRSLNYINRYYDSVDNLKAVMLYILPTLPPILVDECKEKKNIQMAERVLEEAKNKLLDKGFAAGQIETVYRKKEKDTPRDICWWAENKQADAILVNTRGRSRLEAFFMGETARKVLEFAKACPVWLVKGTVKSKEVLIAMDSSENALRAADHAGFMLAGTDCQITLFHSKRDLTRFVPKELLEDADELEELWENAAGKEIAPNMEKAKEMLVKAGIDENQIKTKVINGSRSAAVDILKEARRGDYGTIVMGRRGLSGIKEYWLGSITRKVLDDFDNMAVWIVK